MKLKLLIENSKELDALKKRTFGYSDLLSRLSIERYTIWEPIIKKVRLKKMFCKPHFFSFWIGVPSSLTWSLNHLCLLHSFFIPHPQSLSLSYLPHLILSILSPFLPDHLSYYLSLSLLSFSILLVQFPFHLMPLYFLVANLLLWMVWVINT